MKTQETILAEIESDIHMTVKRRGYAYAGEHAGWLDRAAKRLLKVEDNAVRVELFHFLGDAGAEIDGVKFYGTPWVPIISYSWAFEGEPDTLKSWFSKIPVGLDVLVTHSPPRIPGSDVDRSIQTDSVHFGSPELTEAIIEKRPRLVFCGHIHTGQHGGVDFGGSRVYNVSRLDERYEIAYEPTWLDV